jgi:hypothetical protein
MLTFVAWVVFVWMTFWNLLFWSIGFYVWTGDKPVDKKRTAVEIVVYLTLWFIPGVYLFGWY